MFATPSAARYLGQRVYWVRLDLSHDRLASAPPYWGDAVGQRRMLVRDDAEHGRDGREFKVGRIAG